VLRPANGFIEENGADADAYTDAHAAAAMAAATAHIMCQRGVRPSRNRHQKERCSNDTNLRPER
jgi:hypothetical protein